jgi:nicotinamidase-related amidase
MSASSTDKGLLTPENCAVIFIDHQPQMLLGVDGIERKELLNNVLRLANAAKIFDVPVILSALQSREFSGNLIPQLLEMFPGQSLIRRSSMNAWDDPAFVAAVKNTGRRNFLMAGLWSEACLAFPALQMLEEGYGVYIVMDASHGANQVAHEAALRRIEQAGGVSLTALQLLLEFQRDWARTEHYDQVMAIVKECGCVCSEGDGATSLVHKPHTASRATEKHKEISK